MKKSSIAVISIFGTVGGLSLAIGMCMCLLPEWNAFAPGVVLAAIGAAELLIVWIVYRMTSGKGAPRFTGLHAVSALLGLVGALALGIGLVNCLQVVTTFGLAVGVAGIALLLLRCSCGGRRQANRRSRLTAESCWRTPSALWARWCWAWACA